LGAPSSAAAAASRHCIDPAPRAGAAGGVRAAFGGAGKSYFSSMIQTPAQSSPGGFMR
jgi:hypothetical protein